MSPFASLLAVSILALGAAPSFAQSEEDVAANIERVQGDSDGFFELFSMAQDAVLFDNPTAIADLAAYPLEVAANGELYDIFEPADFIDNFDTLVTEDTLDALASQDYADLIVTSEGVGFANGALWMANICSDDTCTETYWGITRINN